MDEKSFLIELKYQLAKKMCDEVLDSKEGLAWLAGYRKAHDTVFEIIDKMIGE